MVIVKFLITNSVPLNGGDETLLRSVIKSISARWADSEFTILCNNRELCQKYLPDLHFASDLEFVTSDIELQQVGELYRQADIILSAPGGFLHDFYEIEDRLRGFEVGLSLGKPVILLGQSIGPFWKPESLKRIPQVLNKVTSICVRDEVSKSHLINCGVLPSKIRKTADAAFLWRDLEPELFQPKNETIKTVGLCFRIWRVGDKTAVKETIKKAEGLCRYLLDDDQRNIIFLSTCQGIPNYIDDSLIALEIVDWLPQKLKKRCSVNRKHYTPRQLIQTLGKCDAFIGMRLHCCILAMLGGTPAMGLGYERKTYEIFKQLNLESYQTEFENGEDAWLQCAERFLSDVGKIRTMLPKTLDKICQRAKLNIDEIESSFSHKKIVTRSEQTNNTPNLEMISVKVSLVEDIVSIMPAENRYVLVDEEQIRETLPESSQPIPFLERDGKYWGPPPNDMTAISELERLRQSGARFIVFVWSTFWWLDYYDGFNRYLRYNFPCVIENDRLIVFDLKI